MNIADINGLSEVHIAKGGSKQNNHFKSDCLFFEKGGKWKNSLTIIGG